jgi:methylated-DNA-[protein]-cysteine S-methyltransferase
VLTFPTGLGTCGIRWSAAGVTGIVMPRASGLPGLALARAGDVPAPVEAAVEGITALLAGERRDLRDVVLDWAGIDAFRRRVLEAAREVGPGEVVSYGELARWIGDPGGARAVGAALGANPWPIVVPCHRVLGAGGALTGFSAPGGVATKRRMLEIERAPGFEQQPLFA